jgi:hypothetical protein
MKYSGRSRLTLSPHGALRAMPNATYLQMTKLMETFIPIHSFEKLLGSVLPRLPSERQRGSILLVSSHQA